MNIIAISEGGLGNQMFQYAFYKAYKRHHKDTKLDIRGLWNEKGVCHNNYELSRIFKLNMDIATMKERNYFFKRNIFFKRIEKKEKFYYCKDVNEAISFNKNMFNIKDKYIYGYFQSEKYFDNIKDIIKRDFTSWDILDNDNKQILNDIKKNNSVSIHIRRGDYLKIADTQGICTLLYYQRAIEKICSIIEKPKFYIFSNDISWCKKNLDIKNAIFIGHNDGINSYKDMQLMSNCQHNIIANSTFSWWGAWLNSNKKKIVISPNQWMQSTNGTGDIIPENWIKIGGI